LGRNLSRLCGGTRAKSPEVVPKNTKHAASKDCYGNDHATPVLKKGPWRKRRRCIRIDEFDWARLVGTAQGAQFDILLKDH